jgi:dihydroorotate dehydrogenase (NAD+) catalytic subunit
MGGITSGRDALEFILAGASGVSIGTANFGNPTAPIKVKEELEQLLKERGFSSMSDAIGKAHDR